MKAIMKKVLHKCDDKTNWVDFNSNITETSDHYYEGKYALHILPDDNNPCYGTYTFTSPIDLSSGTHIKIWTYAVNTTAVTYTGRLYLFTDAGNYGYWESATFWKKEEGQIISCDLSSLDSETGTLNLSSIASMRVYVHDPQAMIFFGFCFDYIHVYLDVEEKLSKCFVYSPEYRKRHSLCNAEFSPADKAYFRKGDILHIQDPNSVSAFYGEIKDINNPRPSLYTLTALSDGFEFMNKSSMISDTSATTTSFLKQAISDSSLSVEGSLQTTTVVYDYAVGKSNRYLIDHSRYLEYGSFYREPTYDGACYFNKEVSDVASLVDTGEVWTELGSFNVMLIDHRSYDLGITRVHAWGGNNRLGQVNRIATKSTPEQETGIFPTYHYQDSAIMNDTEALQLATKLLAIFGKETDFYELVVQNRGFQQWEKRVNFKWNIDGILTTADDFRIVEWIYDAKFDRYSKFIISNNIVFEEEFKNIRKQLGRDDVVMSDYIDITAPESTEDGTILPQTTLTKLRSYQILDEDNMASDKDTALATQQSIKAYIDTQIATRSQIATGTYTGDGVGAGASWASKQSISIGYRPKFVYVCKDATEFAELDVFQVIDAGQTDICTRHAGASKHYSYTYRLRITDTGFDVSDSGGDNDPNKNGISYKYVAMW